MTDRYLKLVSKISLSAHSTIKAILRVLIFMFCVLFAGGLSSALYEVGTRFEVPWFVMWMLIVMISISILSFGVMLTKNGDEE